MVKFSCSKLIGVEGHEGLYFEEGMPEIPVVRFVIQTQNSSDIKVTPKVDPKAKEDITKINTRLSTRLRKRLNFPFRTMTLSAEKLPGAKPTRTRARDFTDIERVGPKEMYLIQELAPIKGVKRQLVTLFPLQLDPWTEEAELVSEFNIEVNFTQPELDGMKVKKPAFAFIVGEAFQKNKSLESYKKLKEALAFILKILILAKVLKNQSRLEKKLKELIASKTIDLQYALIIGDVDHVDAKDSDIIRGKTDHYYRALDTEVYEEDINGPDIGVGRLTVNDEAELNIVLKKLTKYQEEDFNNLEWVADISFIATDDYTFHKVAEGTHDSIIGDYTKDLGYSGSFPAALNKGGDQLYAIEHEAKSEDLESSFAEGRTIINYSGHGLPDMWHGPKFTQEQVRNLTHDSLPFVISNSCYTGKFTDEEAFAETWLKAANGAIMFWGSMDVTYWDEDDILEKEMYQGIFKEDKRTFAEITQNALDGLWTYYGGEGRSEYYWETYVTFGDPSIKLKSKI